MMTLPKFSTIKFLMLNGINWFSQLCSRVFVHFRTGGDLQKNNHQKTPIQGKVSAHEQSDLKEQRYTDNHSSNSYIKLNQQFSIQAQQNLKAFNQISASSSDWKCTTQPKRRKSMPQTFKEYDEIDVRWKGIPREKENSRLTTSHDEDEDEDYYCKPSTSCSTGSLPTINAPSSIRFNY